MARFEKIQALYDLFSRTREPQPMTALCTELGVSRATANRLIAFLRDERGLDIRYETEQRGYRLQRRPHDAAAVSLLGMGGAEAAALLEAEAILEQIPPGFVRRDTAQIRSNLSRIRQQHLGRPSLKDRVRLRMSHLRKTSADSFAVVLAALTSRRRLEFSYHNRSNEQSARRSCSPVRLTFYRSNWYLAAWCHERDGMRIFSVDRVMSPRVLTQSAHEPPALQVIDELDSSYGIFIGKARSTAKLRFTPLAARWVAEEEWHPDAKTKLFPDGGLQLEVPYHQDTELVMEILRYGPNCEVLGPPALRKAVAEALAAAALQYTVTTR